MLKGRTSEACGCWASLATLLFALVRPGMSIASQPGMRLFLASIVVAVGSLGSACLDYEERSQPAACLGEACADPAALGGRHFEARRQFVQPLYENANDCRLAKQMVADAVCEQALTFNADGTVAYRLSNTVNVGKYGVEGALVTAVFESIDGEATATPLVRKWELTPDGGFLLTDSEVWHEAK